MDNNFKEKNFLDAPIGLGSDESAAWSRGYNEALERTNAKNILSALVNLLEGAEFDPHIENGERFGYSEETKALIEKAKKEIAKAKTEPEKPDYEHKDHHAFECVIPGKCIPRFVIVNLL